MKKVALIFLLFSSCINVWNDQEIHKKVIVGHVSQQILEGFKLQKDTLLVEVDTLGFFFRFNPAEDSTKLKKVLKQAEIFDNYPNGKLSTLMYFCKGTLDNQGFKITLHGSPNPLFNRILTLCFVDRFVIAKHRMPSYRGGKIIDNCQISTDLLEVKLSKYPVAKGDVIRGYLVYKGIKDCTIMEEENRIVREYLNYDGYFECKIE
jgi:hypothetical protein